MENGIGKPLAAVWRDVLLCPAMKSAMLQFRNDPNLVSGQGGRCIAKYGRFFSF